MLDYTVVIGRKTNFQGEQVNINALEITLYKSEELDFGVFTIPATTRFENYQILDRVDITVTDGSTTKVYDPFLIISDEVEPVSKLGYYKHTITFIEDIHKFEKILSSNVFITQPLTGTKKNLLNVLEHIRDVVPFERASVHEATRLFEIDLELSNFLETVEAPQFFFTSMNLREMINGVASYVNAIGRLEEGNNLVFSFYNEILNLFDIDTEVIHRTLSNRTKYFTSSVESSIENAVSADSEERAVLVHPNDDSFLNIRSTDVKITDESFELRVPYPIETLNKVQYLTTLELKYQTEQVSLASIPAEERNLETLYFLVPTSEYYRWRPARTPEEIDAFIKMVPDVDFTIVRAPSAPPLDLTIDISILVDVTSHVYEFNNYKRLDLDVISSDDRALQDYQSNTFHYEIGGLSISNNRLSGLFDGQNSLVNFYRRVLYDYGFIPTSTFYPVFSNWDEQKYRITYVPYFGTRVRLNKDDVTDHPYNTQMSANQGERIVSAERLVRNIYGMAQRLGQDEIQFKRYYTDLSEIFDLGRITSDNFVIANTQLTYYRNYVLVNYLLSKNFNRFANRIALDQENRPFDISLGSKTTNRNLLYNEYIEVDTVNRQNTSLMRKTGMQTFMNTLRSTPLSQFDTPISYGVLTSDENIDLDNQEGLLLKTISFAEGNSLNFYWGFTDTIKAGDQLNLDSYLRPTNFLGFEVDEKTVPVYINRLIRYSNPNGTLGNFELSFGRTLVDADPSALPIIAIPDDGDALIGGHSVNGVINDSFVVNKDKAESLSMNYQLSIVPNYKHHKDIIIGRELSYSNNLIITKNNGVPLYIYTSDSEKYNSIESRYAKGTQQPLPDYRFDVNIETAASQIVDSEVVAEIDAVIPNLQSITSWGIGDADGNLYLGVNVDETKINTLYFNFVNKREKLSYTFDDIEVSPVVAPFNLQVSNTIDTVTATWEDNQNSDSYEVGIAQITDLNGDYIVNPIYTDFTTTNKTFTFTGLVSLVLYRVRVRSVKEGINSVYITRLASTTLAPAKVQNLTVSAIDVSGTSGVLELFATWDNLSGESGYVLEHRSSANTWDSPAVVDIPTNENSTAVFIDYDISNIMRVVRVKAFNDYADGPYSDEVIGVIPDFTYTGASATSHTTIDVDWVQLPNVVAISNQSVGYEVTATLSTTIESGTISSFTGPNLITDSSQSFTPDALIGKVLYTPDLANANGDNLFNIIDNTETAITIDSSISNPAGDFAGKEYFVIEFSGTSSVTTYPFDTTSVTLTGLTASTVYKLSTRAFYTYIDATYGQTKFSPAVEEIVQTLEEPVIAEVIQPTVTTRTGYPTTDSLGWTIFNPNDFDVRLLATISTSQDPTPTVEYTTIGPSLSANLTFGGFDYSTTRILSVRFRAGTSPNFIFSNTVYNSQTTLPEPPPPPLATPTGLTVLGVTANAVTVGWNAVAGATEGYDLNVQTSAGANVVTGFANANATTWDYALLNPETSYQVRIRARATATNSASAYSSFVPFTTLAGAPPRPIALTLTQTSSSSLSASWDSVASATSYDFQLASDSGFTNIISNQPNLTGTSTTVSSLFPATYYGRVRAKNNNGDSDWRTASITMTA